MAGDGVRGTEFRAGGDVQPTVARAGAKLGLGAGRLREAPTSGDAVVSKSLTLETGARLT